MGRTLPLPYVSNNLILGDGEVIDGPPSPKKRKLIPACTTPIDKGKEKMYSSYSFNNNGVLRSEAIKLLENGKLGCYADEFTKQVVNLEAVVGEGIFAKDVLHHAIMGIMHKIVPKLYISPSRSSWRDDVSGLMSVEQVLALMGFTPGAAEVSKEKEGFEGGSSNV
ncbi:hypothetical protein ACET3Z_031449 [Daucus carota]